ncbi:MAG TPA: hypothetical protein VHR41_01600 [Gemmatimonadales bacterium]|jgi:hypothetical protein|nr:hypothetical protein [Gemmatimonadales bacterium]
MNISIINHTEGHISDEELQQTIRAINRQIHEDFEPYWGMRATLRLEGRSAAKPETAQLADMRGDAVIYLWNEADVDNALGYHFKNNSGVPFGFVFTEISESIGEPWSVTLSHEALELLGDPETNLLVIGPHPTEKRDVFHWFEMCDAVQAENYEIDGVALSNFVLPLYFTGTRETDEPGARNDFLGRGHGGQTLTSFGINPGGYIGFFDPLLGDHDTFSLKGDIEAHRRLEIKARGKEARRSVRYRKVAEREELRRRAEVSATGKPFRPAPKPAMASIRDQKPLLALAEKGLEVRIQPVRTGGKPANGGGKGKTARLPRK